MSSAANGERRYQIGFSGVIAEAIRQLQRQATREGRGPEFLDALRTIVERLQDNPVEVGEPLYRLPVLRMNVRCVLIRPLYIDFAVCEDRPLVFIKLVKLLSKAGS
jgi:hypothetical protein